MSFAPSHPGFRQILAADQRFTQIDVLNDQVWELCTGSCEPKALSLSTTYGLRARRLHLFPEFSSENFTASDPEEYHVFPKVEFSSSNFICLTFSPIQYIDAQMRVWVPDSHSILGQMTLTNSGNKTRTVEVDWICQLSPLPGGKPMLPKQMGINKILQGETAGIFPVFYLTGGPEESNSVYPGLGIKLVLMPGQSRQVTWVLASLESTEASFLQARHYSSKKLEIEQLKIMMADKKDRVKIESPENQVGDRVNLSLNQAYQLIMPAVNNFNHPTFSIERSPDTGFNAREDMLVIKPEWSGQTLMDAWAMMHNLLPGRPEVLKGILENFLDTQDESGRIDFRVNGNNKPTGLLAPPLISTLVCELHPYLDNLEWLKQIYPSLVRFLRTWVSIDDVTGIIRLNTWSHPSQAGLPGPSHLSEKQIVNYWIRSKTFGDIFLISLLYREIKSLLQIEKWLKTDQNTVWLEQTLMHLKEVANSFSNPQEPARKSSTSLFDEKTLFSIKKDGEFPPARKIKNPGKIYLQLQLNERISPGFQCVLSGTGEQGDRSISITPQSVLWLGNTGICIPEQVFTSLTSIEIKGWHKGDTGTIGQVLYPKNDIMQFMPLWAGIPTQDEVEKMLEPGKIEPFLKSDGISLASDSEADSSQRIPGELAAMIIEGLLQYGKYELAERTFSSHFLNDQAIEYSTPAISRRVNLGSIENLVPVKLYLMCQGIKKLTSKEAIVTHFSNNPGTVTVQYDKVTLVLKQGQTEIITGFSEHVLLDKPGPHRILLG